MLRSRRKVMVVSSASSTNLSNVRLKSVAPTSSFMPQVTRKPLPNSVYLVANSEQTRAKATVREVHRLKPADYRAYVDRDLSMQ